MSFTIVTDTTANLSSEYTEKNGIKAIEFSYFISENEHTCPNLDEFDDKKYYGMIRKGMKVTTSQINMTRYIDCWEPILESGSDILFVGISSGISGAFNSAQVAKSQLMDDYPDRKIELIDSLGASFGEGLLVMRAVHCRENGMSLAETVNELTSLRSRVYQVFTVDDLMHLKRTGRLSNIGAVIGTMFGIKPILKGNEEGKIVAFGKAVGRKNSIATLAEKYASLVVNADQQTVCIAHADCPEDAERLASLIREKLPPKEILIEKYEPVTGSHVGPGALALFFEGGDNVRQK